MKYIVIGFIKCGQVSANSYIQENFPGSPNRNEIIWREDGLDIYERTWGPESDNHCRPFIITRDPIDRIWSAFRYFHEKNFFDYLVTNKYERSFGVYNPILGSNFAKWIEPFKKYDPWIIDLEQMRTKEGFEKLNISVNQDTMPANFRKCAEDLMALELRGAFWANNEPTMEAFSILNNYTG